MAQGILLVLLLAAVFRVFRKMNAATRHGLELLTLAILVALPLAHFFSLPSESADSLAPGTSFAAAEDHPVAFAEPPPNNSPASELVKPFWNVSLPSYLSVIVISVWSLIAIVRLGFLGGQLFALRRWKRDGIGAPESMRELFSKLCVELKVSRAPQLRVVEKISAPMAVGFKEPAVLLPGNLCGSVSDVRLEQILRHELAHVMRRDDWANLFQQVVRGVFFFHPGVIWASRRMTMDREIACDDHVLSALADRKAYALSLTELASRKQQRNVIAAPAAWSNHSQLKQRINMILDTKRNTSPRLARGKTSLFAAAAMILAILAFQAAPRLAFGEGVVELPPAEPSAPAEPVAPAAVSVGISAAPVPPARPKKVHGDLPVVKHGAVAVAAPAAAAPAIVGVPGGGVLFAAAPPADDDEGGPKVKVRVGGRGDDDLERRMERLEKMVESIRRDTEKKNLQFDFQNKFNPPNFNWNADEFAKMHEKIAKDAERAARDAAKQSQKFKDFQGYQDFDLKGGDGLNVQRKTLEEQKQVLEQQVRSLEKQIQKLEKAQQKLEQERERDEVRADREKRREEEKARRAKEDGEEKARRANEDGKEKARRAQEEGEEKEKDKQ